MEKRPLFSLPYPSTAAVDGAHLALEHRGLSLSMVCDDDGHTRPTGILFVKPRAFRMRAESLCKAWHVRGTYDTVCEVEESDWVAELRNDAVPEWRDFFVMRHFIVYVDGLCLEVIAESASLDDRNSTI